MKLSNKISEIDKEFINNEILNAGCQENELPIFNDLFWVCKESENIIFFFGLKINKLNILEYFWIDTKIRQNRKIVYKLLKLFDSKLKELNIDNVIVDSKNHLEKRLSKLFNTKPYSVVNDNIYYNINICAIINNIMEKIK